MPITSCLQMLRNLYNLWCCLRTHFLLSAAQEPSGPVLLPWDTLSTSCHWSRSRRTYCVILGPIATFLSLLRDPQDLCCCLGTLCPLLLRDL